MRKNLFFTLVILFMNIFLEQGVLAQDKESPVRHLTKKEFMEKVYNYEKNPDKWVYEGDKPAIVDFYATWCGPCKAIAPILEELAKEYAGKIVIYKIDTDKERELSAAFGISSIPTLLFIPTNGDPQIAQGALPKESLKRAIDDFLLGKK
ncbi:thioredoxin [uncultured Bacteroides sp.]|uniref:thioredoxin n=1 Tax=uncultured Bacteroides sp. TaxID=162156 RepID=UPI00260F6145|nr:thioredoxin [uncultured Bacteroides sp.]